MESGNLLFIGLFLVPLCSAQEQCTELPPTIENSSNNSTGSPPFPSGSSVSYKCNVGYKELSTANPLQCTDGKWQGKLGCLEIKCEFKNPPENGFLKNTFNNEIGSELKIGCNAGFNMVSGSNTITCKEDGTWSPTLAAVCKPVDCGEYGNIENGSYEHKTPEIKNSYGSELFVTCDPGYLLNGWSDVTCRANGHWDNTPECIHSSCGSHPAQNSSCIFESSVDSSSLVIICWDYSRAMSVTEIGHTAWCEDGHWSALEMGCFCDCKIKADLRKVIAKNVDRNKFLKHGDQLDWMCEDGFVKKGETVIKCFDGKAGTPECGIGDLKESDIIEDTNIIPILIFVAIFSILILGGLASYCSWKYGKRNSKDLKEIKHKIRVSEDTQPLMEDNTV